MTRTMGIDIAGEAQPVFHSPKSSNWSNVTLPVMSYGYGINVTPLQILAFYNGIANGGKMLKPLFIDRIEKSTGEVVEFQPTVLVNKMSTDENIATITDMLTRVVTDGTARNIFSEHYKIAGKTGTARVEYWLKDQPTRYRASFAGFFPADNPKYSCIVVVHKPDNNKGIYGGSVTAPVFKTIADWVYSRTPRKAPSAPTLVNVKQSIESGATFKVDFDSKRVPNVVGKNGKEVIPALENLGLDVRYIGIGKVKTQSIPAGTPLRKGETIELELEI